MAFIVYSNDTDMIYGTGNSVREAELDAQEWADTREAIHSVHGVAISNAQWRWLEATAALVKRVADIGGDVRWVIGHGNRADLAD